MKVFFCGLGSIGRFHAQLLRKHFRAEIFAWRSGRGSNLPGVTEVDSISAIRSLRPNAVFVTNPTNLHVQTAAACIQAGAKRIFLEKPIDSDLGRLNRFRALVRESRTPVYVGYPLVFHPAMVEVKRRLAGRKVRHVRMSCSSWLPDWRPGRDYRKTYSARSKEGGGVLLDLSHELDLLEFLTGRTIESIGGTAGRSGRLAIDAEDYADLTLRLSGGIPCAVHLDFMSNQPERIVKIDHETGHLQGDLLGNRVTDVSATRATHLNVKNDKERLFLSQLRFFFGASAAELKRDFARKADMTEKLLRFRRKVLA